MCKSHFDFFRDSNLSYFGTLFGPRNFRIVADLLNQTDLDRTYCKRYVDLSLEGRFSLFLVHFDFVSTW